MKKVIVSLVLMMFSWSVSAKVIGPYDRTIGKTDYILSSTLWGGLFGAIAGVGVAVMSNDPETQEDNDKVGNIVFRGMGLGLLLGLGSGIFISNFTSESGWTMKSDILRNDISLAYNYQW